MSWDLLSCRQSTAETLRISAETSGKRKCRWKILYFVMLRCVRMRQEMWNISGIWWEVWDMYSGRMRGWRCRHRDFNIIIVWQRWMKCCYCSLVPRSSNGFCRCFAFQIGKICCHHCIIRHFQFRKCLPVNSNYPFATLLQTVETGHDFLSAI